jgi:hypothetical protein
MKAVIVRFDGLRPDLIGPELTPNILRLKRLGTTLSRHRTVYPSETRVAFPSLLAGATANVHGMVGNKFVDRRSVPPRYIDTSDAVLLDRLDRESNPQPDIVPEAHEVGLNSYRQTLRRVRVGRAVYLDGGTAPHGENVVTRAMEAAE